MTLPLGARRGDGRLLCDFCGQLDPVVYYECANFQIDGGAVGLFDSGDRFYACGPCQSLIDANDWIGLRNHVGPIAQLQSTRVLWAGFLRNRLSYAPVDFPTGINPEELLD